MLRLIRWFSRACFCSLRVGAGRCPRLDPGTKDYDDCVLFSLAICSFSISKATSCDDHSVSSGITIDTETGSRPKGLIF